MNNPLKTPEMVMVSCAVCLSEIPFDQSSVVEVEDYVMYFCGLECYQVWRKASQGADTDTET
jgi:Domain of unknown function (DUF3330)